MGDQKKPSAEELKSKLNREQFHVTQEHGTEAPFSGQYYATKDEGTFLCVCCGKALFPSNTKYDSGTGWPSFWAPESDAAVESKLDSSLGMARQEVCCAECGAHLGHVFADGPQPTGLRYCINSAALDFAAKEDNG